ncbi:MAG: type IV pilus modification PilV family protein [Vicinamibacterales bacterium]
MRGFTLIETLVATGLLAVIALGVAPLTIIATEENAAACRQVLASALAAGRLEELRSLTFAYDAAGLPVSDDTTNLASCTADAGGAGLSASPAGTLANNVSGFVDFLDAHGNCLGAGPPMPAETVFTRRWAIVPLPSDPGNSLAMTVVVTTDRREGVRAPSDAILTTVRTRSAP